MYLTWILGLLFVGTLVFADRTQQEIRKDPVRIPMLCSSFTPIQVESKQLAGDWILKQSLFFHNGVIIYENKPDDDFQFCFELCMKFNIQEQNNTLKIHHFMSGRYRNITNEDNYDVLPGQEPGTFITSSAKFMSGEHNLIVVSGNSSSHLIVAHCKTTILNPGEAPVQVLENLNLISRQTGRRGQSVYKIQELEAQVEMFKMVGLSEAQWSVPYDTTC